MKKLLTLFLALVVGVFGQVPRSRSDLKSTVSVSFVDNHAGAITPAVLRTVQNQIIDAAFNALDDGAPVMQSGSYSNPSWLASLAGSKVTGVTFTAGSNVSISGAWPSYTISAGVGAPLWNTVTGTPTSAAGYGITNGANIDMLAFNAPSYYLARSNHTGTQLAATISDFNYAVQVAAPVSSVAGKTGVVTLTPSDIVGFNAAVTGLGAVSSVNTRTGNITLTSADVGLSNVQNVNTVTRANHTGTQLSSTISDFSSAAASAAPVQSVAGRTGAVVVTTADLANFNSAVDARIPVTSVNTQTGAVVLAKADVGLGNVDNTSDATKNAAVATLTNKTLTAPVINSPTGIVKADVGLGNVDNTSDLSKPVSTAAALLLAAKEPSITAGTTAQYWRGDKTWQTLPDTAGSVLYSSSQFLTASEKAKALVNIGVGEGSSVGRYARKGVDPIADIGAQTYAQIHVLTSAVDVVQNFTSAQLAVLQMNTGLGPVYAKAQTANFTLSIPAGAVVEQIVIYNSTVNAITGGLKIGTTSGGTDVVAAQAVGASALLAVADASILKRIYSTTTAQTLYLQAVSAWNSASVSVWVTYQTLP